MQTSGRITTAAAGQPATRAAPPGCSGDCEGLTRDCTCGQALGMWDAERAHPWRAALLYGLALFGALLASHFWPWGVA